MSIPVIELIAQNLLTTLQTVNQDNGYNYNLNIFRMPKGGIKREHLNAGFIQDVPIELDDSQKVYFTQQWKVPFKLQVFIMPEEDDQTPLDTYANLIRSDVEQASQIDPYRGGNALDTRVLAPEWHIDEGLADAIITVVLEIDYRTNISDPYQRV
jgi:hypothetical protein